MTDPTKVERLGWRTTLYVCPECGAFDTFPGLCDNGLDHRSGQNRWMVETPVIPAQEVERLEQVLRELVEAVEESVAVALYNVWADRTGTLGGLVLDAWDEIGEQQREPWRKEARAALSQAREILGDVK